MKQITTYKKIAYVVLALAASNNNNLYPKHDTISYEADSGFIDWEKVFNEEYKDGNFEVEDIEKRQGIVSTDYDAKVDLDDIPLDTVAHRLPPETIAGILVILDPIGILIEDLFKRANRLGFRQEFDQPLSEERPQFSLCNNNFALHFFARFAREYDFTTDDIKHNEKISSYLALDEETFIDRLEEAATILHELFDTPQDDLDIKKIFGLFKNMHIHERKVGALFDYYRAISNWRMRVLFPFYYLERNFFLTPKELDAIETEFGETTQEEQDKFRKEHVISDKLGFGDMRLEFDTSVYAFDCATLYGGFQFTVPTAFTVGKNFYGSSFEQKSTYPVVDLEELFDLASDPTETNSEKAFDILTNLVLEASDRLAANLIDSNLGNDGHLGIGIFARGKGDMTWIFPWSWAEDIVFTNRISLEYLAPAYETRSFINKINKEQLRMLDFEEFATMNPTGALNLVKELLIKKIYLRGFRTLVQPGPVFRWTSKFTYQGCKWGFSLGTDFFAQLQETFLSIDVPDSIKKDLDIKKSKIPLLWQSKLHTRLIRTYQRENSQFNAWIGADGNIGRQGLANDIGISIGFNWTF